jgi:hypothetical protein
VSATIDLSPTPSQPTPAFELRRVPRYPTLQRCNVWPPGAEGPTGLPCIAYNISASGVGITLPLPLPKGHLLRIVPFALPGARPLRARIVHLRPVEFLWFCGCEFEEPLSEAEVQIWRVYRTDWMRLSQAHGPATE